MSIINASINLSKIPKDKLIEGKKLVDGKLQKYLNVTISELRTPDQFGNTHSVSVGQTKEDREARAEKIYLGSGKEFIFDNENRAAKPDNTFQKPHYDATDDLPF